MLKKYVLDRSDKVCSTLMLAYRKEREGETEIGWGRENERMREKEGKGERERWSREEVSYWFI